MFQTEIRLKMKKQLYGQSISLTLKTKPIRTGEIMYILK